MKKKTQVTKQSFTNFEDAAKARVELQRTVDPEMIRIRRRSSDKFDLITYQPLPPADPSVESS